MNYLKIVCLFLLFILVTSFTNVNQDKVSFSEVEMLVQDILSKSALEIKNQLPLRPSGEGASMPGGNIKKFSLAFDTKEILNKAQLRQSLLDTSAILLENINKNTKITQFLCKNPFTIENVQIILYNRDSTGRESYDPSVAVAQISGGIVTFRNLDNPKDFNFINETTESYQDAVDKAKVPEK